MVVFYQGYTERSIFHSGNLHAIKHCNRFYKTSSVVVFAQRLVYSNRSSASVTTPCLTSGIISAHHCVLLDTSNNEIFQIAYASIFIWSQFICYSETMVVKNFNRIFHKQKQ